MRYRGFLLSLICIALGCADPGPGVSGIVVTYDTLPGGGIHVTNTGRTTGIYDSGAWRLEEDLRLGSVDGQESERFSRVVDILTDSAGRIYVLELTSQDIRVFEPDGTYSHTIGRRGAGPGEFTMAMSMAWTPRGDTLWVVDPGSQRYSAYTSSGTFLTSVPREVPQFGGPASFLPDGRMVDWGLGFPEERPGTIAGSLVLHQPVLLATDMSPGRPLPPLEFSQLMVAEGRFPQPFFGPRLAIASGHDGGIWFANTEDYTVYNRSPEGDTVRTFTLMVEPVSIGEAERDHVRRMTERRPETTRLYLESLPVHRPVIVAVFADQHGEYVFVVGDTRSASGGSAVDVFRSTGEFLARLPLPTGVLTTPPQAFVGHATDNYLYLVVTDESDVPYVSRLRLMRPGDSN